MSIRYCQLSEVQTVKLLRKLSFFGMFTLTFLAQAESVLFVNAQVYQDSKNTVPDLKASGFSTVIFFTVDINSSGDLNLNGNLPLVQGGNYIGDDSNPKFSKIVASLTEAPTSIKRIEFALGGADSPTYLNIHNLLNCKDTFNGCDTGTDSILYKNFSALKKALPNVAAINNDDESELDQFSSIGFHRMLGKIGFKTTITPFTRNDWWQFFVQTINGKDSNPKIVDRLYLQDYCKNINYSNWIGQGFDIQILPGLSTEYSSPKDVQSYLKGLSKYPEVKGGFIWDYDRILRYNCSTKDYANAVNQVFGDSSNTPVNACVYKKPENETPPPCDQRTPK